DPAVNTETLNTLAKRHAIVQCSEYAQGSDIPYVTIDNEKAAYQAVKHLIHSGHEHIALINSDTTYLYAREREAGFRMAMEEHGFHISQNAICYTSDLSFEQGRRGMNKILQSSDVMPTAVFAVSDVLAIGALKEITNRKL